jgi:hypothetical protein
MSEFVQSKTLPTTGFVVHSDHIPWPWQVCNFGIGLFFLELVQRLGLQAVYTSFGVVSLLAIAFANSYIIETKGRSLEEIEMLMNGEVSK